MSECTYTYNGKQYTRTELEDLIQKNPQVFSNTRGIENNLGNKAAPSLFSFEPHPQQDYFYEGDEAVSKSVFQRYIDFKKAQIQILNQNLSRIKVLKRENKTDLDTIKELTRLEQEIYTRLDGNPDLGVIGLKEEIQQLLKGVEVNAIGYFVEKDLQRLEKLVTSLNPTDLQEAEQIIDFYVASGTFIKGEFNPFFHEDELFFEDGSLAKDNIVLDVFREWRERAESFKSQVETQKEKITEDAVNSNVKVQNLYGDKQLSISEILSRKDGLKDLNFIDMWLMDMTSGIFSSNGLLPQVMMNNLNNAFEEKTKWSKGIEKRIEELQPKVEKILKSMGYGLSALGILKAQGVSYKLFLQEDKNGNQSGKLVHRYSKEFFDSRSEMEANFQRLIEAANSETDPQLKAKRFSNAFSKRKAWYLKNVTVLDINSLPEVMEDAELADLSSNYSSKAEAETYKKDLIAVIGEQGYKEEVQKQIEQLKAYKVAKQVFEESVLATHGVTDKANLNQAALASITNWEARNSPFKGVEDVNNVFGIEVGGKRVYNFMKYNISIPRKNEALARADGSTYKFYKTDKETGFYDRNYSKIEADSTLKEFYDTMFEVTKTIREALPYNLQSQMSVNSLPALKRTITEILFDDKTSFYKRISEAARELYDRLIEAMRMIKQGNISHAIVDVITGQANYTVDASFFSRNIEEINKLSTIEKTKFLQTFNADKNADSRLKDIKRHTTFTIDSLNSNVIALISQYLNVPPNKEAIKARLGSNNINVNKVIKDFVNHSVSQQQSFDLPKIAKYFSHLAMEYSARQSVLPIMQVMKEHYNSIQTTMTTNAGETLQSAITGDTRLGGPRSNANRQFEDWWERVMLGNYGTKHIGVVEAIRKLKPQTQKEKIEDLANTISGKNVKHKKYTLKEKQLLEEVDKLIASEKDTERLAELESIRDNLGGNFSATAFFDNILNFMRFKGLGWNISSQVTNLAEGTIANMTVAASGDYFAPHLIYEGYHVVKGSFLKGVGIRTKGAVKASKLMQRFRILQDASNELQKASHNTNYSWLSNLSPYELIRRTEYINQAPIMIAMLKDRTITGVNGETSSIWDALDENGNLIPGFDTEENKINWEQASGKEYTDFKTTISKAIVFAHGNYDDKRGMMAKSTILGKALLMFKTWITSAFYQRYATKQDDLESGIKGFYGRYWSFTPSSGALFGGLIGTMFFGPIGGLIAGTLGTAGSHAFGKSTGQNFFKELIYTTMMMFKKFAGIPVNMMMGKNIINSNNDFQEMVGRGTFTERDAKNMRANLADMSLLLTWIVFVLLAKAALYDDDDSEENGLHNALVNRFMQLASQSAMYVNPVSMKDNIMDMAVVKLFQDIGKEMVALHKYIEGDDILSSGINSGQSRLWNQTKSTFLPGMFRSSYLGFGQQMDRQFEVTPIDEWFKSEFKRTQKQVKGDRAALRLELENQGLEEDEIKKLVDEQIPMPKKEDFE